MVCGDAAARRMSEIVLVAIIMSVAPTMAVIVSWWNTRKQLGAIHEVVNSRLDAALTRIEQQVREIRELKSDVAKLRMGQ